MSTVSIDCPLYVDRRNIETAKNPLMYDIDRKTASRLLKVSVRTVDRYLAQNKLSQERREGRIWLDKKEVLQLKARRRVDTAVDMSTPRMSMDKIDLISVDTSIDNEGNTFHAVESEDGTIELHESPKKANPRPRPHVQDDQIEIYKKLYEELQEELKAKEQRLEMANYRVGQLEARVKDSIPLLDYKRDLAGEQAEKGQIRKDLDANIMELNMSLNNFREERFNKRIYLILLFILLLLQPLWFLFPLK